jgi:RNA polymerase sigma-70 factor (ECF subfamily)
MLLEDISQPLQEKKDEEILALSLSTPDAFSILIDRYQEAFLRKARHILGHDELGVEDIVQDTFVKIYANASKFKPVPGASFKSWGYRILVNTCFTFYQKNKREKQFAFQVDEEIAEMVPDNSLDTFEQKLDRDYLLSLMSKLPVMLARVLKLYTIDEKSQEEIAKTEGISIGAVRTRIHRAKKELKKIKTDLTAV